VHKRIIFLLLFGITFILTANLNAATFNVDTPANFQTALTTAQSNGEDDTIQVAAGTYTISAVLEYAPTEDNSLTISGEGRTTTILDGNNAFRIFRSQLMSLSNAHLSIENISFQNGSNSIGGAVFIGSNSGNITINNCEFVDNSADDAAAAGIESSGAIVFTNNIVSGNSATNGVVGGAYLASQQGPITITGNQISDNTAVEAYAGIYVYSDNATVDFSNNEITQNIVTATAPDSGSYGGGRIESISGDVTFNNNTISDNSALGITPLVDESGLGGGFFIETQSASISMNGNRFNGNQANNAGGGGVAMTESGNILFTNNLIYGNTASLIGGGFGLSSATGTIHAINNTITGNTATDSFAGGLYLQLGEDSGNTASSTAHLYNNIIWGNSAGGDGEDIYVNDNEDSDALQGTAYLYFNNFTDLYFVDGTTSLQSDNMDQDPEFTSTYHLPAESPCVDAGDSNAPEIPSSDIDNQNRTLDGNDDGVAVVDLGADEYTTSSSGGGGGGGGGGCFIGLLVY
jgi:hypothetical protein